MLYILPAKIIRNYSKKINGYTYSKKSFVITQVKSKGDLLYRCCYKKFLFLWIGQYFENYISKREYF